MIMSKTNHFEDFGTVQIYFGDGSDCILGRFWEDSEKFHHSVVELANQSEKGLIIIIINETKDIKHPVLSAPGRSMRRRCN